MGGTVTLSQLLLLLTVATAADTRWPHCQAACGNVSIPYPFGIGHSCYLNGFQLQCNETKHGLRPIIGKNIVVHEIFRLAGNARVFMDMDWECYNESGLSGRRNKSWMNLGESPYTFSYTRNKFTAIGCDTIATIRGTNGNSYASGCISTCDDLSSLTNGSCSGMGCCQTSIPKGLRYYEVELNSSSNHSDVFQFNPCSWAFMVDEQWFNFSTSDVYGTDFYDRNNNGSMRLMLDWAIGNETCEAMQNKSSYACLSNHSDCIDSSNGPGYLCNCSAGYQGNPYLPNGCQDVNECEAPDKYKCYGRCKNLEGNFTCSCPPGTHGDPSRQDGCEPNFPLFLKLVVGRRERDGPEEVYIEMNGICVGILMIVAIIFYLIIKHQERKLARDKQNFFEQNGGILLYDKVREERGVTFKVYQQEELQRATNNFDKNLQLGQGGSGMVYEGVLDKVGKVAIKKAKIIDESQTEQFINELVILSQINHKNVVKLLGCCLEVEVPMLVYEYVANGTLSQHIHLKNDTPPIPFDTRLRIAIESAEALAYLHSAASPPILHGDVKSSNILLDKNYVAKVSDFGTSVLVPTNDAQFAELVQGTRGYLDPEYLQTRQLTEKSDVYSFAVVLLELITGKPALYCEESKEVKSLASTFLSAMRNDQLLENLDSQVKREGDKDALRELAELVKQCLNVRGEERPTMKYVAEELQRLRRFKQHPWMPHNFEEIECLLDKSTNCYVAESNSSYGMMQTTSLDIEIAR